MLICGDPSEQGVMAVKKVTSMIYSRSRKQIILFLSLICSVLSCNISKPRETDHVNKNDTLKDSETTNNQNTADELIRKRLIDDLIDANPECPELEGKIVKFSGKIQSYTTLNQDDYRDGTSSETDAVVVQMISPAVFKNKEVEFSFSGKLKPVWNKVGKKFEAELIYNRFRNHCGFEKCFEQKKCRMIGAPLNPKWKSP